MKKMFYLKFFQKLYCPNVQGILESRASEQGARMTAMDNATRNAGDMIDNLSLKYNRQNKLS